MTFSTLLHNLFQNEIWSKKCYNLFYFSFYNRENMDNLINRVIILFFVHYFIFTLFLEHGWSKFNSIIKLLYLETKMKFYSGNVLKDI